MKENDRKWRKMIETWRKMKNCKKKKKWKKNGKKRNEKKNEKMKKKKRKKWRKMTKKRKKNETTWIHTQNHRRFPGFTAVVVTFFVKILDDFHDFVSECVSFPRKINNQFWGGIVFPKKSGNFHWTWNKNTHFTDENQRNKKSLSPSNNKYSF